MPRGKEDDWIQRVGKKLSDGGNIKNHDCDTGHMTISTFQNVQNQSLKEVCFILSKVFFNKHYWEEREN